ncbi:MAG: TfoX/Sxy family protein [Gemmatimonadota bacterium]|nr:TfoX/Sxy family protein [Gemmatimonadota bacterium]
MAFHEGLAQRVREVLDHRHDVVEKRMFGGLAFMVRGHMTVGVNGEELMLRVGKDSYDNALARTGAREMDFTGRALKGFVYVSHDGHASDRDLQDWISLALAHTESLPPK